MPAQTSESRPCRRNDQHDAHEWERYGEPQLCPGYIGDQAATAKAAALLAPLEAKARALRAERDAKLRAAVLREAAESVQSCDVQLDTDAAEAALMNGGLNALIAFVYLAVGEHLCRMADEAQP